LAFDIAALKQELDDAPPTTELSWEVGVAVVSDTFRLAGIAPPAPRTWAGWRRKWPRSQELIPALARALVSSSLRALSMEALGKASRDARPTLESFLDRVSPLTGEMVWTNPFRREEFLRHWIRVCGGEISGETENQSKKRLGQLDYRQALAEYKKAEAVRKAEAARRAQLLKEAREREEQARGWRE